RQDHHSQDRLRRHGSAEGDGDARWARDPGHGSRPRRPARPQPRPRGPRGVPVPLGPREPTHGSLRAQGCGCGGPRPGDRAPVLSRAGRAGRAASGPALGRRAADAGHCARAHGASEGDAAGGAVAGAGPEAGQGHLRDHPADQPRAGRDRPRRGAERQHRAAHRGLWLRAGAGPHRHGGHLRAAPGEGRHPRVLPGPEGIEHPRHAPLEEEEDMALTTEPGRTAAPAAPALVHGQDTLPRLFRHVVRERGDRVAMREKDLGIWRGISWREYGEQAKRVGLGLVVLGLRARDVVSIVADNMPGWPYTALGVMSVGGIPNGIYTTDSARQIEYIVNDSGTRFFFAENEEQLDKILAVRDRCPGLVKIFVYDMEGLHAFRDEQVMPFEALLELGAQYDRDHPQAFDQMVDIAQPDDLAILVYTSGTTGPPKGAMLTHRNILFQLAYADFITPLREGDQQLSFLPLCHVAERTFTVFNPLYTGSTVNFAESIDT